MAMAFEPLNIDKTLIKSLSQSSNLWGAWLTFHVWAVIIGASAIFLIWPNFFTFILAVIIIGSRQHGMAILMHDAAHGVLFKSKTLNEFVGQWLLAAPYGGDLYSYRKYHLKHHRYAQTEEDPDLPLSNKFPTTKQSLMRKFLRDITGITFVRVRVATFQIARGKTSGIQGTDAFEKNSVIPNVITNLVLFSGAVLSGYWWAYFALWILPLATVFWAVLRLRNIAEHAMTENSPSPLRHARTTKTNLLTRMIFAPYWVNYHVEHHAYMYVPCFKLRRLHSALIDKNCDQDMEYKPGYWAVIKSVLIPSQPLKGTS